MEKAFIVVDMLNDFVKKDGALYCGPTIDLIVQPIRERLLLNRSNGSTIIYLADAHNKNDKEFDRFPPHCVKGSLGAEVFDLLKPTNDDFFVEKTRFSGFYGTVLDKILTERGVTSAEVVGCCTSICVMDTVGGLANRDIKTVVPRRCVADFDQESHAFSLQRMEIIYGASIV